MDGMNVEEFLASGILDGGAVDTESVPDVPQREDGGMSPLHALAFSVWAFEAGGDVQLTPPPPVFTNHSRNVRAVVRTH